MGEKWPGLTFLAFFRLSFICILIFYQVWSSSSIFRIFITTLFLKKGRRYCNRLRPSVRRLCYLLLNHWTKFNQIWCVSYWHKWGMQPQTFLAPPPGEGSKGQISFNFNYKANFKDFYTKLCVSSHKWKIQNISDRIFIMFPGSCPRDGLWGVGVPRGSKKNLNMVMWHIKSTRITSRTECK